MYNTHIAPFIHYIVPRNELVELNFVTLLYMRCGTIIIKIEQHSLLCIFFIFKQTAKTPQKIEDIHSDHFDLHTLFIP